MNRKEKLSFCLITGLTVLSSCATPHKIELTEIQKISEASFGGTSNGCKNILDRYCTQLYSPMASGNLLIERQKPIQILQGETPNQLSQVFYKYSLAKIKNKRRLPSDFLFVLNKYFYFEQLEDFIHRHPIPQMSLEERQATEHMDFVLGGIWRSAIEQTVLLRMSQKYKGFYRIPGRLMPIEYELEERRIRRNLISEFSKVLWRDDSNWKKVADGFNELKTSFLRVFAKLDIPSEIITDWTNKIQTIELVLPGSLPEISDEECSTTTINAYYYRYLNVLTVCAGDFNSEDIILTLAHEMSHALGLDRDVYNYMQKSELATSVKKVRNEICGQDAKLSCEDWKSLKESIDGLATNTNYKPELSDFNKCLKKNSNTKVITGADLDRIAERVARNRTASLASTDLFLRLIKNTLPMKNGKMEINPNFMNPCSYYMWSKSEEPLDDEIYSLIFFASEYKCEDGDESAKLKSAIDLSQKFTKIMVKTELRAEGEFSDRSELTSEGFASPPYERFADVIGTYAIAEYLNKFNEQWERRTKFLAGTSWLCEEPSLDSKFPEESKVVMQFSSDSHTQGEDRKLEMFSQPIREALSCEKDFEFNECRLPFKSEPKKN